MNWQLAAVLTIVGVAVLYLSWHSWRAWRKASQGCSGGCGCASPAKSTVAGPQATVLISSDSLKLRALR